MNGVAWMSINVWILMQRLKQLTTILRRIRHRKTQIPSILHTLAGLVPGQKPPVLHPLQTSGEIVHLIRLDW